MSQQSNDPEGPPAWMADKRQTWGEVFQQRLGDGTAWTEGFTEEEVSLPVEFVDANDPEKGVLAFLREILQGDQEHGSAE